MPQDTDSTTRNPSGNGLKTLVIGLDAACRPVLDSLIEAGLTPTLESIFDRGVWSQLESQIPPWTASAWPSLYTGMNPGKHGVFDFLRFDGYDWDIVNATDVRERTLWEYADEAGLTSVVVNAPVTSPPPDIDGAVVPGYLASEAPPCHPDGILADLRDEIGDYRVYAAHETDAHAEDDSRFQEYLELTRMRGEAFRYLADRFEPDFGFIEFQKTDAVFHDYPGDDEKVRVLYRAVDEQLGEILEACDPDTVIVASDHGIGEYDGYEFRVNQALREASVVETKTGGQGVPSWFQIKDEQLTSDSGEPDDHPILERLAVGAARIGLTHQRAKSILDRLGLTEFVGRYVPVGAVFAASDAVDFANSTAYLRSPSELGVRLNVAGRDPDGVVDPADYDQVREKVIALLEAAETPSGKPVFESVVPRETHIHGPYADEAVDILAIPVDFQHSLSALLGERFGEPEPWNHKRQGVVAIAGRALEEGRGGDRKPGSIDDAHLFDIAPTVLSTLGIAPAVDMDGSTLSPVRALQPRSYPSYQTAEQTVTEDEAVAERLSDLGYLE